MRIEPLLQIEELAEQLDHTFYCQTYLLASGHECDCGTNQIKGAVAKLKLNMWKELKR